MRSSLRELSPQEIQQVGGAARHEVEPAPPETPPGLPGQEPPFPPELNPVPQ
jgi:hypothetical protein